MNKSYISMVKTVLFTEFYKFVYIVISINLPLRKFNWEWQNTFKPKDKLFIEAKLLTKETD